MRRIRKERRRISVEGAADIVRTEFTTRRVPIDPASADRYAKQFLRAPLWPLLHPVQARREGYRVGWPWVRDRDDDSRADPWDTPPAVDALANQEAWRLAGSGVGPMASNLEPAECERLSGTDYRCIAGIPSSDGNYAYLVEVTITLPADGNPRVIQSQLRPQ